VHVDQAKSLLALGDVRGAYAALAAGGDTYAQAACELTSGTPSLLGRVVEKYWDRVYGSEARQEKRDDVARTHLTNYINQIEVSPDPLNSGNFILPNTTFIEDSYASALESNGLSKDGAVDLAINQMTQPLTISSSDLVVDISSASHANLNDVTCNIVQFSAGKKCTDRKNFLVNKLVPLSKPCVRKTFEENELIEMISKSFGG